MGVEIHSVRYGTGEHKASVMLWEYARTDGSAHYDVEVELPGPRLVVFRLTPDEAQALGHALLELDYAAMRTTQ